MKIKQLFFLLMAVLMLNKTQATTQTSEHVPLDAFTMLPAITSASVSKDGKQLAYLRAQNKKGNYIIEIRQTDNLAKKPIRLGADNMQITGFVWLNNEKLVVFFRQKVKSGSHTRWTGKFAITNSDGSGKWLEPFKKGGFELLDILPDVDDEVLIRRDVDDNDTPDVVRYNIKNRRKKTVLRGNTKRNSNFVADKDGEIRAAASYNRADNSFDFYARIKGESEWKLIKQNFATERENYDFIGFSVENDNEIYINANMGEDKSGIYLYNISTGNYSERLFGTEKVNAEGVIFSNKDDSRGKLLGFGYTIKHPIRYYTDEKESEFYNAVTGLFKDKYVSIASRSEDDNAIVIRTSSGRDPGTFYLLKNKNQLEKIGSAYPLLKPEDLAKVKYISYKARDGRKIPAYVTIPKGKKPYPTIVLPHGGPWVRDVIIYDEWSQLLAHHGYLVIQPQYRGSTGFGIDHWKAGDNNWGLTMQDDLDDAAQFLVKKGLADVDRLTMFGWSYGGYAAFVASTRENNIYQCAIAGAGVSDLNRVNATIAHPFGRERQKKTISGISPINLVDKVNIPLLVVHGDIDSRVPIEHSRAFVDQLKDEKKDYKYVELEGADHFSNTLNYNHKTQFYGELLNWLASKCGS